MHLPRTDSSQTRHPSIYSSSRIASLWRLFPYLAIPPRYSTANALTSFSEMVLPNYPSSLYHPESPSQALCLPQLFSNLLRTALPDLMTWREQTCVCTLYQRKSSTQLPRTQGRVKMHESSAGTVIWAGHHRNVQRCTDKCSLESRDSLLGATYHVPQISPKIVWLHFFYRKFY